MLLQTTAVQTFVANKAADWLKGTAIDAEITIDRIHIKPFNTLIIKRLTVIDEYPCVKDGTETTDTLFHSEYITARFTFKGLTGESIRLGSAKVQNARMNLVLEDGDFTTNLTRMFRIPKDRIKKNKTDREIFNIKEVEVTGTRFTMKNLTSRAHGHAPGGINWNDLDVMDINIKGRDLGMKGKIMSGELDRLSFREKSGYSARSLSGKTRTGHGVALIENLKLTDNWSNIDIPYFCMKYESDDDFAEFVDKVRLEGTIRPSGIGMKTLGYFAPGLSGNTTILGLDGNFSGTVSDLTLDRMHVTAENGDISGEISGRIAGLPDTGNLNASVSLSGLAFTTSSLSSLIRNLTGTSVKDLGKYAEGEKLILDGNLHGNLDEMGVNGKISSGIGNVDARLVMTGFASKGSPKSIAGRIRTSDLDLKRVYGKIPVRECSMTARLKADLGGETPSLSISSLRVRRLNLNDYDYSGIVATGTLSEERFNGKVICNDPNLNFMFQGIFSLSGKTNNALYRFYANIGYADLNALNIDRRGRSQMSLQTNADFTGTASGYMLGKIDIADITLENAAGKYDIGDIMISSFTGNGRYRMRLASSFAEGSYTGSAPLPEFIRDVAGTTLKKELPALFSTGWQMPENMNYDFSFRTSDSMDLLSFLAPGMYIAEDTSIRLTLDRNGLFNGRIKSGRLAMNEQYIKDIDFEINNAGEIISGEMKSESIYLATVMMKNNSFKMLADNNHIGLEFSYDNQDILENRGEIVITGDIGRTEDDRPSFDIRLLPSSVYLNSREWNIYPSEILVSGKDMSVKGIEFHSGEQSISISGGLSETMPDTLGVRLDNFDLSIVNPLIGEHFALQGAVSGLARITSPGQGRGILLDLMSYRTSIADRRMGDIAIKSSWDSDMKRFDIMAENDLDGKKSLSLYGNYVPSGKRLDVSADLDMLDLSYASPFLEGIFSDMGGNVSGQFTAEGPLDNLSVRSDGALLQDARMTVAFTNVEYTANGPFHVNETGLYFDDITIRDRHGHTGKVTGGIGYDHFRNMEFGIDIDVDRMEAVNLSEEENSTFYGHLSATGNVNISGPMNSIRLTADASTAGSGELHVPIPSSLNAGSANLLRFKEPETEEYIDPYELMIGKMREQRERLSENFALKLRVTTTPEVEVSVEIDKANGNVLKGRGTGNLELSLIPSDKTFNITGDYTISSGNYHFVALGIAARNFSINEGSTIRFNGDLMDSNLNIEATYRTKASLSALISDESSVDNRRIVDCGIRITDRLSNPRLAFSIDIPDINPTVKARVESALSSEDKIQKQFLSLLISNNFLPDEQSGIVNNSSVLFSNVTDIMTNQLNNIFQKLNIPLDLGFDYQQNDQGNDIFDVAVSTQLFNNRVIVNGNIGNKYSTTGGSRNSDVVGDIDIEIKLDRPGAFRLNLFSHSADQYTNYLDNSQRNGVGITYQQEFNNFGQFVRRIFMKKAKREEAELQEVREMINEKKNHIKIGTEDEKSPAGKDRKKR